MQLARAGGGSAGRALVTASGALAREFILGAARAHGRIQVLNEESSVNPPATVPHCRSWSTEDRDVPVAARAGGLRSVKHYMQRTAIQGSQPCWPLSASSAARR
ncbi:hypothetical protein ACLK2H_08125 [Escherichia coli]